MKPQYGAVFVLAIFLSLPVNAQGGANLTPPDLTPSIPPLPPPPVPVDANGNPIPVQEPTAEQLEAARVEQEQRAEQMRLEEEKHAVEAARVAEDESRAAESLAEQKQFHDRVMWAIYIALGLFVVFVGTRLVKKD